MQKLRKPWEQLNQKQKARIVAKDAIEQIKSKTFIPGDGYFTLEARENIYKHKEIYDLKENIHNITCEGCVKGSLFLSHVERFNNFTFKVQKAFNGNYLQESEGVGDNIYRRMEGIFTPLNLDMIEAAYERAVVGDKTNILYIDDDISDDISDIAKKCIKFGGKYKLNKSRLLAILENIAKYGEFKP